MTLYLKDPKNSKRFLEIINTFGKGAGYKINLLNWYIFYVATMNRQRKKPGKQFQ
jgi:hypothetical protein